MRTGGDPVLVMTTRFARSATVILVGCLTLSARAQFAADSPEPPARMRGKLVMGGDGQLPEAVFARFVELAGRKRARILVFAPAGAPDTTWNGARSSEVSEVKKLISGATAATGVWIEGRGAPATIETALGDKDVVGALRGLLAVGGVVGADVVAAPALRAALKFPATVVALRDSGDDAQDAGQQYAPIPGRVTLAIEPRTALVLEERWMTAEGDGEVRAVLAPSAQRPLRVDRITGRRRGDLISLWRAAVERTLAPFPASEPPAPRVEKGSLLIVGGGSAQGMVERFIELAGGPDAPVVFIPCSYAETIRRPPRMLGAFRAAGARNVSWIHTKDRERANSDEAILGPLRNARGIWFGGGRQWNFVDSYQHTTAHQLMHDVLERGGVIAGSSAGASIQAGYLARGNPLGNREIMAEGYERGLGFLGGVAVDQHFSQRRRQPDMTSLVNTYPQLLGIGIDEGTGLLVRGSVGEVIGRGKVFFYDRRQPVLEGKPDYQALPAGQRFDLVTRDVIR